MGEWQPILSEGAGTQALRCSRSVFVSMPSPYQIRPIPPAERLSQISREELEDAEEVDYAFVLAEVAIELGERRHLEGTNRC